MSFVGKNTGIHVVGEKDFFFFVCVCVCVGGGGGGGIYSGSPKDRAVGPSSLLILKRSKLEGKSAEGVFLMAFPT